MTDTTAPADRRTDLQERIAHLDRKIEGARHEIACWQEDLNDLEIERAASCEELDELRAQADERLLERIWAQVLERHQQELADYDAGDESAMTVDDQSAQPQEKQHE